MATAWSARAQQRVEPPATPAGNVTLHAGINEVLLDVVVRDKKGQRVTNLDPG
jgi:hypothetical protein